MNNELKKHPAVRLGQWLRERRMSKGVVKRQFAARVGLRFDKYAEAEFGVGQWIKHQHMSAVKSVLSLTDRQLEKFHQLLDAALGAKPLAFGDVFSTQDLKVVRARTTDNRQLTEREKEQLLTAVFTPLT